MQAMQVCTSEIKKRKKVLDKFSNFLYYARKYLGDQGARPGAQRVEVTLPANICAKNFADLIAKNNLTVDNCYGVLYGRLAEIYKCRACIPILRVQCTNVRKQWVA